MAKPSSKPAWTVGNPDFPTVTVEPTNQEKVTGWLPDQRPPSEWMNWLFYNIHLWINYFETETDAFANQSIVYDAFVGAGGSHADINALMADPDIAQKKNILVVSSLAVDATQVINQPGMNFEFKAGASITKNGPTGAAVGLQINAARVRINNGRFVGFNDVGEKGVEVLGSNNILHGNMFNDCTISIDDQGANNILNANLEEV